MRYRRDPAKQLLRCRRYRDRNPERVALTSRRTNQKSRLAVLAHYGGGRLACLQCGEMDLDVLALDHINDDGAEERKALAVSSSRFFRRLIRLDFPPGYQTLCHNCNIRKEMKRRREHPAPRPSPTEEAPQLALALG
jgi:hypothetical protein